MCYTSLREIQILKVNFVERAESSSAQIGHTNFSSSSVKMIRALVKLLLLVLELVQSRLQMLNLSVLYYIKYSHSSLCRKDF